MTDGRTPVTPTPMRAAIARRMVQSKQQAPHFYVATELDMEALTEAAARLGAARQAAGNGAPDSAPGGAPRIGLTAFLLKAVALTLAEHRTFNAVWEGDTLMLVDAINIGVAIALDDGLIAPAVLGCETLGVEELGAALADLVARTRAGKLRAAELTEATFTLSNLGMFEVSQFTAIVVPPQVSILATGRSEARAMVRDGTVVVRRTMNATLSSDHRAVDGAGAARFLGTLKGLIERPDAWIPASARSAT
jgi:pyruvate dehydrogenase E2 component (dihydrolipoamide acetyltransferase)